MTTDTVLQKRLLDHLRTAVMMLDGDLRVRYLNPAAEMLLATSASRIIGQRLPEYFFDDEDARGALQQCMDEGHPFTRREARLNVAPGQQAMVDYSVSPIHERGQSMALLVEMQSLDRLLRITREEGLMHAHQATRALVRSRRSIFTSAWSMCASCCWRSTRKGCCCAAITTSACRK